MNDVKRAMFDSAVQKDLVQRSFDNCLKDLDRKDQELPGAVLNNLVKAFSKVSSQLPVLDPERVKGFVQELAGVALATATRLDYVSSQNPYEYLRDKAQVQPHKCPDCGSVNIRTTMIGASVSVNADASLNHIEPEGCMLYTCGACGWSRDVEHKETFEDLLKETWDTDICIGGVDMPYAFVWVPEQTELTDQCRIEFRELLEGHVTRFDNGSFEVDAPEDLGVEFLAACAGYRSEKRYAELFKDKKDEMEVLPNEQVRNY